MVQAITYESLVANLCEDCPINELPGGQQGVAASAALLIRLNMGLGMEVDTDADIESVRSLRAQAHDISLTDEFNNFIYSEEETRAAIKCARCHKLGECPVSALVKGMRDESKSSS
jgi:hypothetical protein